MGTTEAVGWRIGINRNDSGQNISVTRYSEKVRGETASGKCSA